MSSDLIVDEPGGMALADPPQVEPVKDLRHLMMLMPIEQQQVALTEYAERRNYFRGWLRSQLEEGIHYGYPPGCEPKQTNPKQWQAKPSLYAAGADLLCDLLGLRVEYNADQDAWAQLGSKPGMFVMRCVLFSRQTGELIGEGRGVRKEGQKGGDANNALKMAQKSAKVDAVLNAYGLRELFTQDLDIPAQPLHDNPAPNADLPPPPAPRGQREPAQQFAVTKEQMGHIAAVWKKKNPDPEGNMVRQSAALSDWVIDTCHRGPWKPAKQAEWFIDDYLKCCRALNIEAEGVE